ncbi:MAG: nitroreductase family protein, partial [Bacilli bacterium]
MTHLQEIIDTRRSVKVYDKEASISKEELLDLLNNANKAPSAWNLQHWHFKVFHSDAAKQQLLPIAYNQQQVADCSAVIAVLADTQVASKIDAIFGPAVEAGFLTEEVKASLTAQIQNAYSDENNAKLSAVSNAS